MSGIKIIGDDIYYDGQLVGMLFGAKYPSIRKAFEEELEILQEREKYERFYINLKDQLTDPSDVDDLFERVSNFVDCETKKQRKDFLKELEYDFDQFRRSIANMHDVCNAQE